jgi:glycerophosphoryl diester phosphodiesterase
MTFFCSAKSAEQTVGASLCVSVANQKGSYEMLKKMLLILCGGILILFISYEILRYRARPISDHSYFNPDKFLVIAHRGGRNLGPENTLITYKRAVELGVDVIELDVHRTKDKKLVVLHDATVNRTTDGKGPVQALTLAQLKKLDAGFHWSPDNGRTFPFRGKKLTVPTLPEVFTAFRQMRINIEIKKSQKEWVPALCRQIQQFNMTGKVMVASFDSDILDEFREQCPAVATSTGAAEAFLFYGLQKIHWEAIYTPKAQALQVPENFNRIKVVTQRFLDAAHSRNMRVHVWTVNNADDMQRLLGLKVDGIMTDDPQKLMRLIGRK